jgi:prephenate dehydrogenase
MTIGLIGYGRFGKLAARFIAKRADLLVFDRRGIRGRLPSKRIKPGTLEQVASQCVVILAVPISGLRQTLRAIRPHLRPHALVIDVCSVKVKPVQWLKRLLPSSVDILGSHPLFGPDSVQRSLVGRTVVLCPVRVSTKLLVRVKRMLSHEGLIVKRMDAHTHDRMVAETLLVTQYVGRLVLSARLRRWPSSTVHYEKLEELVEVSRRDSLELFRDIWHYNPYAARLERTLRHSARRVRRQLAVRPAD